MKKEMLFNAFKKGMQGEMDSVMHYQKAVENSDGEVQKFFMERVEEEKMHYNYLLRYFQELSKSDNLFDLSAELAKHEYHSNLISNDFVKRIGQKQILFSAVSTALLLEKNGIDFYKKSAQETEYPEVKKFFEELARWEEMHYNDLLKIQKEAEEFYWEINSFEPF